ncbi:MAG: helix-turn-helix transcriptional regulator [Microbacterium sp.]|nr:helix-turn-helix transcriptional regulator [Microbacterium sp.]
MRNRGVTSATTVFSVWLRRMREHRGYSQEELAHRAGVSVLTCGRAERGTRGGGTVGVTVDTCIRIILALDPSPQEVDDLLAALGVREEYPRRTG